MYGSPTNVDARGPEANYALGNTDAEQERLIRQAALLAPCTERFFREAGIASGQRVLDIGSGVGDVAMLVAQLVGASGEVVGIERDPRSVARARARAADAGLSQVTFTQRDASDLEYDRPFDAVVGRFILQFLPDPLSVVRRLEQVVRPGGIIAFQEVSYTPFLALSARLPLWSAVASIVHETIRRSGADTEIGLALHQLFQEAGFCVPTMRMEILLGSDPGFICWIYDLLSSLRPKIHEHGVSLELLGDFTSLPNRLQAEVAAAHTVVPFVALVEARSVRPDG
jgi:2-polyprenyl-3-methyl-5-hydroxy-6-metoxy-1,4-benzoquinol methylase